MPFKPNLPLKSSTPSRDSWPVEAATTYNNAPAVTGIRPDKLFDITCVIGSVYEGGTMPARAAAFLLIAEHGAVGTYSFPEEDGGITTVTVGFTPAKKDY